MNKFQIPIKSQGPIPKGPLVDLCIERRYLDCFLIVMSKFFTIDLYMAHTIAV